jgi:hypothetical protein
VALVLVGACRREQLYAMPYLKVRATCRRLEASSQRKSVRSESAYSLTPVMLGIAFKFVSMLTLYVRSAQSACRTTQAAHVNPVPQSRQSILYMLIHFLARLGLLFCSKNACPARPGYSATTWLIRVQSSVIISRKVGHQHKKGPCRIACSIRCLFWDLPHRLCDDPRRKFSLATPANHVRPKAAFCESLLC